MNNTTELIKELVGLCVDKDIFFTSNPLDSYLIIGSNYDCTVGRFSIFTEDKDSPDQLQAAIDRVRAL
tara:strand:- start:10281 stop:10484 length:204 start_codon:yes stop_codon:yes gene_type:complete